VESVSVTASLLDLVTDLALDLVTPAAWEDFWCP
jgi:hypothetical protein